MVSDSNNADPTNGSQVVAKVGRLLRALGNHEPSGATTSTIARETGMSRPTAHRLLSSLSAEGLLGRDFGTGRWLLGPELYLLGAAAALRFDITEHARDIVHLLAAETGESAFLSARRGDETVCLLREDGSFPLRSHVLFEGARFPLGVASAGLAVLAHLSEAEAAAYLARADLVGRWGDEHAATALSARVALTRDTGYAVNPGLLVEGSWGMAAAVFDQDGRPGWALSVTGVESRFRAQRQPELGRLLLDQAYRLSRRVRARH